MNILIVEDDRSVANLIAATLRSSDYRYQIAQNGREAILQAASHAPDIILLDLGLPDIDGVEVIESVRGFSQVPIIVISARSEDSDKITALDAGADDYLTKPFSVEELLARLRSTARRLQYMRSDEPASPLFINGVLQIDRDAQEVSLNGEIIHLTPVEYRLLTLLAQHVGKVLTHSYLMKEIWHCVPDESVKANLRVNMASLRRKIEKDPEARGMIQTHVGIGYRLLKY